MASPKSPVAPGKTPITRLRVPPILPVTTRIFYFFQIWAMKALLSGISLLRSFTLPASTRPTLTKTYPIRPSLPNRVFVPRDHVAGTLLPLYLDIHGGGFALCSPDFDDEFCSAFANKHNVLVVSINYSKGPVSTFPIAPHDCAAIAAAVIDDETLPIDKDRVAIGGFASGGNLSLAAVQLPELKGKIKAVVPWYPVTDLTIPIALKAQWRAYEREGDVDGQLNTEPILNWSFLDPGQDLTDPLLSVSFAKKEDLPKWIYMIGAQYDMLATEAWDMILELAGIKNPTEKEKDEFEKGTYKWSLAKGVKHGFTHEYGGEPVAETMQKKAIADDLYKKVGDWLFKGPFSTK